MQAIASWTFPRAKIPRDVEKNLAWRVSLLDQAALDSEFAEGLRCCAAADALFFCDAFMWVVDPRKPVREREEPFVLWETQEELLDEIMEAITEGHDHMTEKSRDVGVTWLHLGVFLHQMLFTEMGSFMCVSRKADLVDKTDNPDALFPKLRHALKRLPGWLVSSHVDNTFMHLKHSGTQSVIDGETTTGDVARGGRRTAILLDEFAAVPPAEQPQVLSATADVTNCRLIPSTPRGINNEFYRIRQNPQMRVFTFPWWKHPGKAVGLYWRDGKPRSIWYDAEELRRASRKEMAQEVDIDYRASGSLFFDPEPIEYHLKNSVRPPLMAGELLYSVDSELNQIEHVDWQPNADKPRLRLWTGLDNENCPSDNDNYVIGVDISHGQGASNSVISVASKAKNAKVAEFTCPNTPPHELARQAVAMCMWFAGQIGWAFLVWENNGPGGIFGKEVLKLGYPYIYWLKAEQQAHPKDTDVPGWHSGRTSKELLLGTYRRVLARQEFLNPSEESIRELLTYVRNPDGGIGPSRSSQDDEAREAHGDRVIADALMIFAMGEQSQAQMPSRSMPTRSWGGRRRTFVRKRKRHADRWR